MTFETASASSLGTDDLHDVCRKYKELVGSYLNLLGELRDARSPDHDQTLLSRLEVHQLRQTLERFRSTHCEARFRVVLVGSATAGKSALVNALTGHPVLPEGDEACTLVPTIVRESPKRRDGAYLRYLTGSMLSELLRAYANRSESDGWPLDAPGAAELDDATVDLLVRSLPQRADQQHARALLKALRDPDVGVWVNNTEDEGLLAAANPHGVTELIRRSGHRSEQFVLDAVVREIPKLSLGGEVEIVDLPGSGGMEIWAQEAVLRHLRTADAVLLVADGEVGEAERRLLDMILQRAGQSVERVFLVLSRMDRHRGQSAESLRRAYSAVESGWQQAFGGAPLRLCYTSARHAMAQVGTSALTATAESGVALETDRGELTFPPTHHEIVDRLLDNAKDGGVIALQSALSHFLREDATRLRREQLAADWRELVDRAGAVVKPAAGRAGLLRSERALGAAQRAEEIITELDATGQQDIKALRRIIESVEGYLADGTNDLLTRLKALAFAACTEGQRGLGDEERKESARDVAMRIVPAIRETFEELCMHAVLEFPPVLAFCDGCQQRLTPLAERLSDIGLSDLGGAVPTPPVEPSDSVRSCLELRISESLRTHGRGSPHRPADENTQFGRFEEAFTEDVRKFQNRQARQLVADLGEFLAYYLSWHLDRFEKRFEAVTSTLMSPEFAANHPEVMQALAAGSEEREEQERLDGLSRLAERLDGLAQGRGGSRGTS